MLRLTPMVGAAALALTGAASLLAATTPTRPAYPSAPTFDGAGLGRFFDSALPSAMKAGDIAGASVAVVEDGRVVFEKGYGKADVASGRPVDAERTLFRMASTSKLLTWTAVMQLVETHRLDLDRDVNAYLDFHIPPYRGQPVTLRDLMTHSAGFEESYRGLMSPDKASTPTLEHYVKAHLPARIDPPHALIAYSNYGATLAGYIVQRVTGEPFEDYVARHIFAPLGMGHSTYTQPPGPSYDVATGYERASGPPFPFEYASDIPAGGLSSTAADMARFMIGQLGGTPPGVHILSADTLSRMHATAFRPIPSLNGMALGFYEEDRNGHRILGHAGDLISFHTDLHLLPDDHVGLFLAMNSWGKDNASTNLRTTLFRRFLDRFFPTPPPAQAQLPSARADGATLVGRYMSSRRSVGNFASIATLLGQGVMSLNSDGSLSYSGFRDERDVPLRWRETAPMTWREVGGRSTLAAKVIDGRVVAIGTDEQPPVELLIPVPPAFSAGLVVPVLGIAALIFLALLGRLAFLYLRHLRRRKAATPAASIWAIGIGGLANLVFVFGWPIAIVVAATRPALFGAALDPWLRLFQLAGVIGIVVMPVAFWRAWTQWTGDTRWPSRLLSLLPPAAFIAALWYGLAFHLFALRLAY